jgi:hypothetical protein
MIKVLVRCPASPPIPIGAGLLVDVSASTHVFFSFPSPVSNIPILTGSSSRFPLGFNSEILSTDLQSDKFSIPPRHQLPFPHHTPAPRSMDFNSFLPWVPLPPCILAPSLDLSKGTNHLRSDLHGYSWLDPFEVGLQNLGLWRTQIPFRIGALGRFASGPAFG